MLKKYKLMLWIIGAFVTLVCIAASWWFTVKTDQGPTYWASTIGTAIGGMAAVAVAVFLWHLDSRAANRQNDIDSNAKTVEVILNSTREMKSIVNVGSVYEKDGYPYVKDDVDSVITAQASEITSAMIWMRDEQARSELVEILAYLSSNTNFLMFGPDVRYATTVRDISKWLEALCHDLLRLENNRQELPNRAAYAAALIDLQEMYADEDRWRQEEWDKAKALLEEERASQAKSP